MSVEELAKLTQLSLAHEPNGHIGIPAVEGDIVFAPIAGAAAAGVLLDRRTGAVEILRTALSLEHYVWAKQRGFILHAPNRIVIGKQHDLDAAVAVLRVAFDARYIRAELVRAGKQALALDLDWPQTALLVEALRDSRAFDYEVNPA